MDRHDVFVILMVVGITIVVSLAVDVVKEAWGNPYALPDDHFGNSPEIDRERPTLIWCPTGPWEVSGDTDLNLSIHDNNEFAVINYTIAGYTFDLLNVENVKIAVPLGYYPGDLYVADEFGNYENRYGYGINFTAPSTVTIKMIYQENQADTYSCKGFDTTSWLLQPAYAASTQFSELTIVAGNATSDLQGAQDELTTLMTELEELKEQLLAEEVGYDETYIVNLNATHQAEVDRIIWEYENEIYEVMYHVNNTLTMVDDIRDDVREVIALCQGD